MITMLNTDQLNTEALVLWGLDTDEKPIDWWTDQWNRTRKVGNGSRYYEMNTKTCYSFDEENSTWHVIPWEEDGGSGGEGGTTEVSSELTRTLIVSRGVGGINAGTTYTTGKDIEDILHDMLDPVAYPTLTAPTATLTAPGSKILETGSNVNVVMTISFNRGTISPAYGTNGFRAGTATGYKLNDSAVQAENTFNVNVSASNKTFTGLVNYNAGEQPRDSSGENYKSPLSAGSVSTNTLTYEFVDALYSNASNITTVVKEALVSKSAKQKEFNFAAQTVANPEIFEVPASWTITAVEFYSDLSGKYENCLSGFTITNTTHEDASGNTVNYKRYTDNRGYAAGARKVRIKWS